MRFPPNLKYFILFILAIGVIVLATIYLPKVIPQIGEILIGIVTVGMFVAFFFIFIKPFITFIYARADGIFEVFVDQSEKGLHIFSYHLNSGGSESVSTSTRDIQHYFLVFETGKIYFKRLFTHSMEPASGRSGWGDFYGFEESVLGSNQLPVSIQKLSAKAGIDLKLGRQEKEIDEHHYEIHQDEYIVEVKKYSNVADEGIRVTCTNRQTGRELWKKKI